MYKARLIFSLLAVMTSPTIVHAKLPSEFTLICPTGKDSNYYVIRDGEHFYTGHWADYQGKIDLSSPHMNFFKIIGYGRRVGNPVIRGKGMLGKDTALWYTNVAISESGVHQDNAFIYTKDGHIEHAEGDERTYKNCRFKFTP
ncbi:hypothetical protein [Vibrio vulnificus]|uniref:hypothetical protein n=1 Tax=Vibrio vulnificus TaxID=672 RepID=UPI001022C5E8|nr:hypothetical protein [Vibrio vulnificus]RZQ33213.1 hypothetical protein D8T38_18390 [Vibrio vulnificus]